MEKVLLESPFAGKGNTKEDRLADEQLNIAYARACMHDCFMRDEAPYASHLLYTQDGVLDDDVPDERELGIEAGLLWGEAAEKSVFYLDRGLSGGMKYGLRRAIDQDRPFEFRVHPDYVEDSELIRAHRQHVRTLLPIYDWPETAHKHIMAFVEMGQSVHGEGFGVISALELLFGHNVSVVSEG